MDAGKHSVAAKGRKRWPMARLGVRVRVPAVVLLCLALLAVAWGWRRSAGAEVAYEVRVSVDCTSNPEVVGVSAAGVGLHVESLTSLSEPGEGEPFLPDAGTADDSWGFLSGDGPGEFVGWPLHLTTREIFEEGPDGRPAPGEGVEVAVRDRWSEPTAIRVLCAEREKVVSFPYKGAVCSPGTENVPGSPEFAVITGCVADPEGVPVRVDTGDGRVTVAPLGQGGERPLVQSHTEWGRYVAMGPGPGRYRVTVRAEGYEAASRVVEVGEGGTTVADFVLRPADGS